MAESIVIEPQPGPQTDFLRCPADIVIYGGAAGSGKSFALLLDPLRNLKNPKMKAIIFRQSYPQLTQPGGLWDESLGLYSMLGGAPKADDLSWRFTWRDRTGDQAGMTLKMSHLEHENDKLKYQGGQFGWIGFDELPHFSESQFWYMLSRLRGMSGVAGKVRATCNPDSASWVYGMVSWYLRADGYPDSEKAGRVRYFVRDAGSGSLIWSDDGSDLDPDLRMSFAFIPATIYDNRKLLDKDPQYLKNLRSLPTIEREQLLGGRWVAERSAAVLPEFDADAERDIIITWARPGRYRVYGALDHGVDDMTAYVLGYHDFRTDKVVMVGGFDLRDQTTQDIADEVRRVENYYFPGMEVTRFSDVNLQLIIDLHRLHGLTFTPSRKDDLHAAVNELRFLIQTRRLIIDPVLRELILHLRHAEWEKSRKTWRRSAGLGHMDYLAAAVYLVRNIDRSFNPYPPTYGWDIKSDNVFYNPALIEKTQDEKMAMAILNIPE